MKFPSTKYVVLSTPAPFVLLVRINLEKQMNSLPVAACWEMHHVWEWYDQEPELRVAIVTGTGRAFSAGMDLKEHIGALSSASTEELTSAKGSPSGHYPPSGFAGITRRKGKKPILSAVNGHAHGGGFEIVVNSDLVFSCAGATFAYPDVKRGTAALMGGLPRLERIVGYQHTMWIALLGATVSAEQGHTWGLINEVVSDEYTSKASGDLKGVLARAVEVGSMIASMSPDSVIVTRAAVIDALEGDSIEVSTERVHAKYAFDLMRGENAKEGIMAFVERRSPVWKPSKL